MLKISPFEKYADEYDAWYDKYSAVFISETEALRAMLPPGNSHGIEVGLGTGRFSVALGIKEGVEPAAAMRAIAQERGIEVMNAKAENLPYKDMHFDFVLMASCVTYLADIKKAFNEANRVLKKDGSIIVGVIDKNGKIGQLYESRRNSGKFNKYAVFYTIEKITDELKDAGFGKMEFLQTLFKNLDEIKDPEFAKSGYGEGSYVVIKAVKR